MWTLQLSNNSINFNECIFSLGYQGFYCFLLFLLLFFSSEYQFLYIRATTDISSEVTHIQLHPAAGDGMV